ncbi:TfuA-like protein [Sorangium sp. KYC3313]|uniref:TfuA-like protein n=1 Tax=Sorangium sp. KYC3313 TaxID=3449740 RepID=UPI003F8A85FE
MSIYIFTGPTIAATEAKEQIDAVFLPPAAQGDVYRAALDRPVAIGIIDGYFERTPSVSHKEILWAMGQGVHVFGAASMGALRAAELSAFGMEGVGTIYGAYARGELDADDEVAVAHGSAEDGYRPMSEAMVNVRATLRAAEVAGALPTAAGERLEQIAKRLFYTDRCYPILLRLAAGQGVPAADIGALRAFLPEGRVDQKRTDALELLRLMRERFTGRVEPKPVRYHFEATDAWEHIRGKVDRSAVAPDAGRTDPAVEELKRSERYAAARRGALARALALEVARRQGRTPEGEALRDVVEALCRDRGLAGKAELASWLARQGVIEVERFLADEAQVRWVEILYGPDADRCLPDHLRSTGEYASLRDRALARAPREHGSARAGHLRGDEVEPSRVPVTGRGER